MTDKKDKAYTFIFNEFLDKILQLSENPSQFGNYLTQQIREIVGARTIVIAIENASQQVEIYSVFPERRREWANLPAVLEFSKISFSFENTRFIDKSLNDNNIQSILNQLDIEKIIAIPLIASGSKVGSILLFDIMDVSGSEAILDILTRLSGISALIIRNSVLFHNLQETVAIRTRELENRNEELNIANIQLNKNIEKRKHVELELIKAKEKAEESDRLKTAFLQNMSHEIRTPMNAIMGFSELMAKNFDNKIKLIKFSEIIARRCNDLLDIINDILDIAKIESGQLPVNMEECNLDEMFSELYIFFREYQVRLGKQDIEFSLQVTCDSTDLIIIADKVKLKQILINLIINAFKFTERGSVKGGCRYDETGKLLFFVSDTGIGIPEDKQQMIFERFTQVNQGSKLNVGGTGLGLSIVKGLIGLMGGEIYLESSFDKGSTFTFTIPFKTAGMAHRHNPATSSGKVIDVINKTVLIVEDDLYNAEYLKEVLSYADLNILHTDNGEEAVDISMNQQVDLILMDVRLPGMDGYEATRQIKAQKPGIKIIAQTAYAAVDEKKKAFDAGCDDYISKPARKEAVLSIVDKHLL
jgi:signal transduction histidine kinase/CheY-like chemotaxis protein